MRQVARFRASGIVNDLPAAAAPADSWSDGLNVHFRQQAGGRIPGHLLTNENSPTDPPSTCPLWLINYDQNGTNSWLYVGPDIAGPDLKAYIADSTPPHTNATPVLWGAAGLPTAPLNYITGGILNGIPFLNVPDANFLPCYLVKATPILAPMTTGGLWTAGDICGAMRAYKQHLVAMDYTPSGGANQPDTLLWSDAAAVNAMPTTFTPAAGNEAGSNVLSDTPGPIVDGWPLRGDFYVYKRDCIYVMTYVGGNAVMAFRLFLRRSGVLSRNCVKEYRGRHFVFGDGDIYAHDGVAAESVIEGRLRRWLISQIDTTNWEASFVALSVAYQELWCCFPEPGAEHCTLAAVLDLTNGKWSIRELPYRTNSSGVLWGTAYMDAGIINSTDPNNWSAMTDTWATVGITWAGPSFSAVEDALVAASPGDGSALSEAAMYRMNTGTTANGAEFTSYLVRRGLDLGSPDRYKTVTRVWPRLFATDALTVRVRVGASGDADGPYQYAPYRDFVIGTDEWVDAMVSGRYLAVEIRSESGGEWRTDGLDFEVRMAGRS